VVLIYLRNDTISYIIVYFLRTYLNTFWTTLLSEGSFSQRHVKLMMITGVIETFAICRWYRFHWPWFSL